MNNDILILTSGSVNKIIDFKREGVTLASFSDVCFDSKKPNELFLKTGENLKDFKLFYFRLVGKSLETASMVADFAKENNIEVVDKLYTNTNLMPISLAKSLELRNLSRAGIPIPHTVYNNFESIGFPMVIKSTSGQKAREVWKVENKEELEKLKSEVFEKNKSYFAQELVPNARRVRALVIGSKVVGAIMRHTKWFKDETKVTLDPIPDDIVELSVKVSNAVELDICGVDILINTETDEKFVIEANAAPAWKLINKYCGVVVEDEVIKYLQTKL